MPGTISVPVPMTKLPKQSASRLARRGAGAVTGLPGGRRFRRRVRSHAVAERPVLFSDLDQVHPRILAPQAEPGKVFGDLPVQATLFLQAPAGADRDLHDDDVVATRDAEVLRVV